MTPGLYLQLRRTAAKVPARDVEILCDFGAGELALVEAGERTPTADQVTEMRHLFPFNPSILRGLEKGLPMEVCRGCGCSTYDPCGARGQECHWAERGLCSACAAKGVR